MTQGLNHPGLTVESEAQLGYLANRLRDWPGVTDEFPRNL